MVSREHFNHCLPIKIRIVFDRSIVNELRCMFRPLDTMSINIKFVRKTVQYTAACFSVLKNNGDSPIRGQMLNGDKEPLSSASIAGIPFLRIGAGALNQGKIGSFR